MKLERARKHDDEGNAYEFVVKQKNIGKFKRRKTLFLLSCVGLVLLWFVFGIVTRLWWLLCLIPLSVWIFYYFVHPYVSLEYKYAIESNTITYSVLYGERLEGKVFSIPMKDFTNVAPYIEKYKYIADGYDAANVYNATSCPDAEDVYFATFEQADGTRCIFFFEATGKALKMLKYYNGNTVVTEVKR